jgi:hypothetical protein
MKSLARFGRGEDDGMKDPCAARMHKYLGNEGALQQGVMVMTNLKYNRVYDLLWDSGEDVVATEGIHMVEENLKKFNFNLNLKLFIDRW